MKKKKKKERRANLKNAPNYLGSLDFFPVKIFHQLCRLRFKILNQASIQNSQSPKIFPSHIILLKNQHFLSRNSNNEDKIRVFKF
jgi:hypothetical protein